MSHDRDSISRAQLIGGMIATGALAACGRSANPASAPIAPYVPASPNLARVNQIFSDPAFKDLDKEALVRHFDPSPQIEALHRQFFRKAGPQPQIGKVIRHIPKAGFVIGSPGTYKLGGDILWAPYDVPSAAITIASSNVTLDLAGFTLRASVTDKGVLTAGILVGGLSAIGNVTIVNGTVANLTEYGIVATGVIGLTISRVTVTGVSMQNLDIRALTPAGICVSKSVGVTISRCAVTGLNVTTDSCAGIIMTNTSQATVSRCRTSRLVNNDGAVQGFSYINCTGVTTTACAADSLQSHFNGNVLTTGHTVLGFVPIFCLDLSYADCAASRLTGCCDDCHAMSVFLDGQVSVTRFRGEYVVDGVSATRSGAKATGLEVYGASVTVTDSAVSHIKAINPQDQQATGFSAWGLGIAFERCKASNVTVEQDMGTTAHAEGFGWAPDPRPEFDFGAIGVTYTDCTAESCQVGFDTWYHVNSKWIHPKSKNCKIGILVQANAKRSISCDPCSECDPAFTETLTNIARGNKIVR